MQSNALSRKMTSHASEIHCADPARQSRRLAVVEGISLWLAVLLFFVLQSVVAEASEHEKREQEGAGTFHFVDQETGRKQPATRLANIPPGEAVSIELRYQQAVRYQSGARLHQRPFSMKPGKVKII